MKMTVTDARWRRLWDLFYTFARISALVIGGGYAILPVIEQEFVNRKKWIKAEDIVDVMAIVQSVPGIIAINAAVFIGYRVAGAAGALAASIGSVLPPFVVISAIAAGLAQWRDQLWLNNAFTGVRAAVCALILLAAIRLGKQILQGRFAWFMAGISLVAIVLLRINAVWLIVGSGLAGIVYYRRQLRLAATAAAEKDNTP